MSGDAAEASVPAKAATRTVQSPGSLSPSRPTAPLFRSAVLFFALLLVTGGAVSVLAADGGGALTVAVDGLESDNGSVAFALYDSEATYLETPMRKERLDIERGEDGRFRCRWTVPDLPPGDYALSVYHDEDGDGELDKGAFGIPTEAYGFSNDARGTTGPPGWGKSRFRFAGGSEEVRVRVR